MKDVAITKNTRERLARRALPTMAFAAAVGTAGIIAAPAGAVRATPVAPVVTTTSLPSGTEGVAYSATLDATHPSSAIHWSLTTGSLPSGLHLVSKTGQITGTPRSTGDQSFTVTATGAGHLTGSAALSITIAGPAAPTFTTTSLPGGTVATPYLTQLDVSGGTAPYHWKITAGQLPTGLFLNHASGQIVGDPRSIGTSNFTVQVTDQWDTVASEQLSITVVAASSPTFVTTSLPSGTVGASYAQTLQATGGNGFYHFEIIDGQLPKGFSLDRATGQIIGLTKLPTVETFTVLVTDGLGDAATAPFTLTIN